jgi:hypothetical protein
MTCSMSMFYVYTTFSYCFIFLVDQKIRAFSPPSFVKISRTLFIFLDQSDSSVAAILGTYLHPALT